MRARFFYWGVLWLWGGGLLPVLAAPGPLSNTATVSLLTVAPGAETYALFGHSALRVTDPRRGLDQVYNFGTFDFDTPHFYWRFLRGDLRYFLSVTPFAAFKAAYQREQRPLTEQVLALRPSEAQRLYDRLESTLHSPAKYYRYQFFADNCTTRLAELVRAGVEEPLAMDSAYAPASRTYRQLLAPYLAPAPWVNLGMNLGLGWPADRPATFRQRLFLPTELQQAFAHTRRQHRPFVAFTRPLLAPRPPRPEAAGKGPTPTGLFVGLWLLVLGAGRLPARYAFLGRRLRQGLFVAVGATGCVLLGLQVASLHTPAHANYQLLWLLPTHVRLAFARPSRRWRRYATVSLALLALGALFGYGVFYAQIIPEVGWLLSLLFFELLMFVRHPLGPSTLLRPALNTG